jgi:hypothetical protein
MRVMRGPPSVIMSGARAGRAGRLATVHIDCGTDTGEYWEPNVWIIHHT